MSIIGLLLIVLLIWALLGAPADNRNVIVIVAVLLLALWAIGAFGWYYPAHEWTVWP